MVNWKGYDMYILLVFKAKMYKVYPGKLSNFTLNIKHLGSVATPESKPKL